MFCLINLINIEQTKLKAKTVINIITGILVRNVTPFA